MSSASASSEAPLSRLDEWLITGAIGVSWFVWRLGGEDLEPLTLRPSTSEGALVFGTRLLAGPAQFELICVATSLLALGWGARRRR